MAREIVRVEPLSTWLERWKAPTSAVTRHGDTVYVSGFPPFDPDTGEVAVAPIARQAELVLEQMKLCLEAAGSSLDISNRPARVTSAWPAWTRLPVAAERRNPLCHAPLTEKVTWPRLR